MAGRIDLRDRQTPQARGARPKPDARRTSPRRDGGPPAWYRRADRDTSTDEAVRAPPFCGPPTTRGVGTLSAPRGRGTGPGTRSPGTHTNAPHPVSTTTPSAEGFLIDRSGRATFNGTDDRAYYRVRQDGARLTVLNVYTLAFHVLDGTAGVDGVTFALRGGDDHIWFDGSVTFAITVLASDGDDIVDATALGVDVFVHGGTGDDRILAGAGDDTLEGGYGEDELRGGAGEDWIHGRGGNDALFGQGDADIVVGGTGYDVVMGGEGADALYGGDDSDALYGDAEDVIVDAGDIQRYEDDAPGDDFEDLIVVEAGSNVQGLDASDVVAEYDPAAIDDWLDDHDEFVIDDADPEHAARVRADLGAMLAIPYAADLLEQLADELDDWDETIVFLPEGGPGGTFGYGEVHDYRVQSPLWTEPHSTESKLIGGLLRDAPNSNRFPLPVMFHELVHAYQWIFDEDPEGSSAHIDGEDTENDELQATGFSWYDEHYELQPGGVGEDDNGVAFSDNTFRKLLGVRERLGYSDSPGRVSLVQTLIWRIMNPPD